MNKLEEKSSLSSFKIHYLLSTNHILGTQAQNKQIPWPQGINYLIWRQINKSIISVSKDKCWEHGSFESIDEGI